VLEKKQQMLLNQKIEELAQAEEMKINEDQIESAFFKNASETRDLKDKQQK
jgi:Fe-S cluster biosynthesis and repair protein YggX